MGLTKAFSLLLLFLAHLDLIVSQAIIRPPKIDARTQYLYSNASASATLSIRPFTFSFAITAYSSVPSFGYGLNDFKFNNSLSRVYFLSEVTNLTATSVTIQTTNDNATKISKLSISYIAVW
jgi:O-antigen ligase